MRKIISLLALLLTVGCAAESKPVPSPASLPKIDPSLVVVAQQLENGVDPARFATGRVRADTAGRIQVYVYTEQQTPKMLQQLSEAGLQNMLASEAMRVVQGWVHPQQLNRLADLPFVRRIAPPVYGFTK